MNKKNILQRLSQNYFQGIADDISNAKVISATFSNMSDVGDVRENILLKFLQSHLPLRCSVVKGGCVFDSQANESKQIDLLITNDASLRFSYFDKDSHNSKNIQTIEGCLAAISVKSTLDKKELENALENLASIPAMPKRILEKINPSIGNREEYLSFPKKIVFAFSGSSVETIRDRINEFYSHKDFKDYQKADLIIVNNSFCIEKIGKGGAQTKEGHPLKEGTYYLMHNKQNKFGAFPLLRMLILIQNTTGFCPQVILNYNAYVNAMNFHDDSNVE